MRHLKGHLKSIIVSWERQLCTVWTTSGSKQSSSAWWLRRKGILVRLPVKRTVIIAMSDCVGIDTRNPAEILMTFTTSNWYGGSTLVYRWLLNFFFFTTQVSSSTSCRCYGLARPPTFSCHFFRTLPFPYESVVWDATPPVRSQLANEKTTSIM